MMQQTYVIGESFTIYLASCSTMELSIGHQKLLAKDVFAERKQGGDDE